MYVFVYFVISSGYLVCLYILFYLAVYISSISLTICPHISLCVYILLCVAVYVYLPLSIHFRVSINGSLTNSRPIEAPPPPLPSSTWAPHPLHPSPSSPRPERRVGGLVRLCWRRYRMCNRQRRPWRSGRRRAPLQYTNSWWHSVCTVVA